MGMIDQILREAEEELFKGANDPNGAPEQPAQQQTGDDILSVAKGWLSQVEQLKAAIGQTVAGSAGGAQQPEAAQGENQMPPQDVGNNVIIARPDGTQIKVAHLRALASMRGGR